MSTCSALTSAGHEEGFRCARRARLPATGNVDGMSPEEIADLTQLRKARDFMDRNYAQRLSVPAVADRAWMSPAHFSRKFRAAYGETRIRI